MKGPSLRRKAIPAARNHSRPWSVCQTAHPRAKTSWCSGMETTVLWNLKSSTEVTQARQKSILKSTIQPPVQSALNVSGEFFTWSQQVSWNRFRPSCKKSSISFWRRRQSAITASWPVVSSPLWFVPWALPNGVYLLVVNLTDSRHAVRHLAFILTFQTNLKLLVHPWYMSQRVHADTEHRRGENLKRKTQQWHYLSPHNPASLPACAVPPTSPAFADKLRGSGTITERDNPHLPVARNRCIARRSCGEILTFISLSVCLKAEKSCFLSRWATFFFVLLSAGEKEGGRRKEGSDFC